MGFALTGPYFKSALSDTFKSLFKSCFSSYPSTIGSGDEEAIILIHGFPASSFDYHRAIQTLETGGHPVLMFDHLGFGFSDRPKEVEECFYIYSSLALYDCV